MIRYLVGLVLALVLGVVGCSEPSGTGGGGDGGSAGDGGSGGSAGTGGAGGVVRECTADDLGTECKVGDLEGLCLAGECRVLDCSAVGDETFCLIPGDKVPSPGLCSGGDCLAECEVLEEGAACNRPEYPWEIGICAGGSCEPPCEIDADCTDYKDCTADTCLTNGLCESVAVQDGSPCGGGTCEVGECVLQGSVLPCTEQGIRNAIAAGGGPYTFDCQGPTSVVAEAEIVIDNDVILDGEGHLMVDGDDVNYVMFSVPEGVAAELRGFTVTNAGLGIDNDGTLALTHSTVSGNSGGIQNYGTLTLTHSTVSGNGTSNGLAGIQNNGTVTLTHSTVSGNTGYWGGIFNDSVGTVTLTNSTVSGNTANGVGGGGILSRGTLTLTNSTVSGNAAGSDDSSYTGGGGIRNGGTLTLINSTVSGNTAKRVGGGIRNGGTLTLTNSTVSGNTAGSDGGGIYNTTWQTVTLTHSTVSGNSTSNGSGGGIYNHRDVEPPTALTLSNTLVDNDCAGTIDVSGGGNLESPGDTCGFSHGTDLVNITEGQLDLGPLADNGGPTMTHAIGAGSVAIDVIPEAKCLDAGGAPLTTDQRGVTRPQGGACDVGAVEMEVTP